MHSHITHTCYWLCCVCVCADLDRPYCQVYTVQLGDMPSSVAGKFGISEEELFTLNAGRQAA